MYDEIRGSKRDFKCKQSLLTSNMGYFSEITKGNVVIEFFFFSLDDKESKVSLLQWIEIFGLDKTFFFLTGQKLEEMDISVHCEITIFEWLIKWMKAGSPSSTTVSPPKLGKTVRN